MEIVAPELAAALQELQVLDPRQRPVLAAHRVALDDLAATPQQARATITVTSSEGRSTTFEAPRGDEERREEGRVRFAGSVEQDCQAAELGSPPSTHAVDLVRDGRTHPATATWPADLVENSIASVALSCNPLPPVTTRSAVERRRHPSLGHGGATVRIDV